MWFISQYLNHPTKHINYRILFYQDFGFSAFRFVRISLLRFITQAPYFIFSFDKFNSIAIYNSDTYIFQISFSDSNRTRHVHTWSRSKTHIALDEGVYFPQFFLCLRTDFPDTHTPKSVLHRFSIRLLSKNDNMRRIRNERWVLKFRNFLSSKLNIIRVKSDD